MKTKEQLKKEIETWEGVNKYIVKEAKEKLKELGESDSEELDLDLNNDGKVDEKDASIASKVMNKIKKDKKKKSKKRSKK